MRVLTSASTHGAWLESMRRPLLAWLALAATLLVVPAASGSADARARAPRPGRRLRLARLPHRARAPSAARSTSSSRAGASSASRGGKRTTFLDITPQVRSGGEQGLLGGSRSTRATRRTASSTSTTRRRTATRSSPSTAHATGASPCATRVLMNLPDPAPNHNGGQLVFGPDGFLWWGNGDGGGAGDQFGNGQKADGNFAKIMRMDVDKRAGALVDLGGRPAQPVALLVRPRTARSTSATSARASGRRSTTSRAARRTSTSAGTATRATSATAPSSCSTAGR